MSYCTLTIKYRLMLKKLELQKQSVMSVKVNSWQRNHMFILNKCGSNIIHSTFIKMNINSVRCSSVLCLNFPHGVKTGAPLWKHNNGTLGGNVRIKWQWYYNKTPFLRQGGGGVKSDMFIFSQAWIETLTKVQIIALKHGKSQISMICHPCTCSACNVMALSLLPPITE